jgi:predicted SAM-dependent methyltransferase
VLVNVACGPHVLNGYVNVDLHAATPDVLAWDCRRSLPLADDSAAGIRAEQFVEHLETREELPDFLRDCYRVLRAGGVLRVIVPDAERFLQAYCAGGMDEFRRLAWDSFPSDLPTRMDVINHIFHQWHEHRWGYDFETLEHRLTAAGFSVVQKRAYRDSMLDALATDREVHAPYSLYVDAAKA